MSTRRAHPASRPRPLKLTIPGLQSRGRLSYTKVPGTGPRETRLMLIGEGPGRHEDRERRPFVGPSGQLLTYILETQKPPLLRSDLYITNVMKYRVLDAQGNDDTPTPEEQALCLPELYQEIADIRPEVIITAGGVATRALLPGANLELLHGLPQVCAEFGCLVVPCYHPASALHDTDQMSVVWWDYQRAVACVHGLVDPHVAEPRPTRILTPRALTERLGAADLVTLGVDTEDQVDGRTWCVTASFEDGSAVFIPGEDREGLQLLHQVYQRPGTVCFIHNGMHDLQRLRALGLDWTEGYIWTPNLRSPRIIDTMVQAYEQGRMHTQALKTLAYRKLGVQMASYEDVVGPVAQQRALDYLMGALGLSGWSVPEPDVYWDEAQQKLRTRRPLGVESRLKRIIGDWLKRGTGDGAVDLLDRWAKLPDEAQQEIEARCGAFPRTDLSHCHPTQARHYACQDADMTRQLGLYQRAEHQTLGLWGIAAIDHGQVPLVEEMQRTGLPSDRQYFLSLGEEMQRLQSELAETLGAIVGYPVNPKSGDQVADLLYGVMGMKPLRITKSKRPSTDKKSLEHLRGANLLVDLILQSREYDKVDSSFCQNIARRTLATDDGQRAFYQLQITRVKTGRLAAKDFNALAIPVRTELGRRIRYGFRCRPGRLMGTWDLNQIEMRMMAHESQDPAMCEVYNRSPREYEDWQRDLHIYTASQVTGIPIGPEWKDKKGRPDLTRWRTACKSTGFGILMGITGKGLSDQMRLYGLDPAEWTEDRCNELIRDWLKVFKGVERYQLERRAEARRAGMIRGPFGRLHRLPHARLPSELHWIADEALRQSHALPIQDGAQCIEKLAMARIYTEVLPLVRNLGFYLAPMLQVHDELLFEFDEGAAELVDQLMMEVLTTTVQLRVPVEAGGAIGPSWGDLEK